MSQTHTIPTRQEVPAEHRWNLSKLYANEQDWEADLKRFEAMIEENNTYKGKLGTSSDSLFAALEYYKRFGMLEEKVGHYAQLRQTEDEGNSDSRGRVGRFMMIATKASGALSWFTPELQKIPETTVRGWMAENRYAEYRIFLERLLRQKPHILSEAEERLLALAQDTATTPAESFSVLTNVDMDFGTITTKDGPRPLSQSSYSSFMHNQDRSLRQTAYMQFYKQFEGHKNTLAQLYAGQVKLDAYEAKVRNFPSARAKALFPDNVPESVYDNLVKTVNDNLPVLHRYYELRKRALKLDELRHYDVYVPLVGSVKVEHSWEEAVAVLRKALAPLGSDYVDTLCAGLMGTWADRYENKGKRSGAFSWGSFQSEPYIMMNYKSDVIRDIFTLAHEGGHSMHSWHSTRANPFMHYHYTIFEAEVASTFNEALLFKYMTENAASKDLKTYLVASRTDDLLATLFRQTMFAEYEHRTHAMLEAGEPLTVDALRSEYRKLLVKYFGPAMKLEEASDMEGLRIPHFYRAFYVYKYATGISASIALADKVLSGQADARDNYFKFLSSGGSRFPIDALKVAGVDMSTPAPIQAACAEFGRLVGELEKELSL